MEKNEILIGRQVEKGDYPVDEQYKSVGRKHARITRKPDGFYIEDLDSANGTFVNGKPVSLKKITVSDKIRLGDDYELNLEKVLKLLPMPDGEFQTQFLHLKQVYEDYQTGSNHLQTKGQEDMMTKRMLPTMLLGVITTMLTAFVGDNASIKTLIGVIGGILTVAVFLIATKMASKSTKNMREKLARLNENFELNYVCPACGISFRGKSWEFLKRAGKCPACQREFKV